MGNDRKSVLTRTIAGCLGALWFFAMGLVPSAEAAAPEAVCFVYADSLAVTVDSQSLLGRARSERLESGYPLSCELRVALYQRVPLWFDEHQCEAHMRWRLLRRTIDGRFQLSLVDFQGRDADLICDDLSDVHRELDAHLLALLAPLASLDSAARYYVETDMFCQTLSFDDVVKTERWLKQGSSAQNDSSSNRSRSPGETALRYLWDVAGLRPEKESARTEAFKAHELRRLD